MSFYGDDFKPLFTHAINGINLLPFPLTDAMYTIGVPGPRLLSRVSTQPTADTTNTKANFIATGVETVHGDSYYGQVPLNYTRLDLGLLFKGVPIIWETSSATTTQDFAKWARENLSLPFNADDLVARPVVKDDHNSYIPIKAATTSPYLIGEFQVWYTRGKPDIGDLIPDDWQSGAFPALPPLDSFYALTYHKDYTGAGNILRIGGGWTSVPDRARIWGVVMGDFPNQYATGIDGEIITGEANIVAAGGRPGFKSLFKMKLLNIWAHFND